MNNKIIVAIIILVTLCIFAWLVDYGWQNRYGSPETYQVREPYSLAVGYHAEDLALEEAGIFAPIWQTLPGLEVVLKHQITERPWPQGLTEMVKVQAFHNGKDIFFRMSWKDDQIQLLWSCPEYRGVVGGQFLAVHPPLRLVS